MSENYIENKIVKEFKKAGWFVRKSCWVSITGCPDRFFSKKKNDKKLTFFIEFKDTGEPLREDQVIEINSMREAGIKVFVVDNLKLGMEILQNAETWLSRP